jgi:hypothetical protein
MAKLSAHGRTLVVEATKTTDLPDGEHVVWRKVTYRLMSDGTILRRLDVRFRSRADGAATVYHSYGWKVYGKLHPAETPKGWADTMIDRGYTVTVEGGSQ